MQHSSTREIDDMDVRTDKRRSLTHLVRLMVTVFIICIFSFVPASNHRELASLCVKPHIFVGVFTDGSGTAKYAQRRSALRTTWFPNTTDALKRVECTYGITIRFVVGSGVMTNDTNALKAWHDEMDAYEDFLKLDVLDTYRAMTGKTAEMFRHVMSLPQNYEYVVKVDDDMFVSLNHLAKAVNQWADMKVDYVGCMTNPGKIYRTEGEATLGISSSEARLLSANQRLSNQTSQVISGTNPFTSCSRPKCICTRVVLCMPFLGLQLCTFSAEKVSRIVFSPLRTKRWDFGCLHTTSHISMTADCARERAIHRMPSLR